jgi:hypothetical protein
VVIRMILDTTRAPARSYKDRLMGGDCQTVREAGAAQL